MEGKMTMNGYVHKQGFTLVEVLVSLAISALLMCAIAAAFDASIMNYQENRDFYDAVNRARQALARMTTQLRTGYSIDPGASSNQCNFWTAAGQDLTYEYRSSDNTLYLITNSDSKEYVLCEDVQSTTFIRVPTDDGLDCKSVRISLTVAADDFQHKLASAVVIRRNLEL